MPCSRGRSTQNRYEKFSTGKTAESFPQISNYPLGPLTPSLGFYLVSETSDKTMVNTRNFVSGKENR